MDNVILTKYFPELNRLDLIKPNIRIRLPDVEQVIHDLNVIIRGVDSETNSGIHLGYFFTNTPQQISGQTRKKPHPIRGLELFLFPFANKKIKYVINKGDFFANQGRDPNMIIGYNKKYDPDQPQPINTYYLFEGNPFFSTQDKLRKRLNIMAFKDTS